MTHIASRSCNPGAQLTQSQHSTLRLVPLVHPKLGMANYFLYLFRKLKEFKPCSPDSSEFRGVLCFYCEPRDGAWRFGRNEAVVAGASDVFLPREHGTTPIMDVTHLYGSRDDVYLAYNIHVYAYTVT